MRKMSFLAGRQRRQNPTLPTIARLFFSSTSNSSVPSSTTAPTFLPPLQTIAGTQSHAASGNHERRISFSSGISAIAISLGGAVMLHETAYADAGFEGNQMPETASSIDAIENLASKERKRLEDMISEQGLPRGTLPPFSVSVKGSKIIIKFQVPQKCEVPHLIVNVASNLGLKVDHHGGSEMILRAWDSAVAWQVALYPLESLKKNQEEGNLPKSTDLSTESLCIFIFKSLLSSKDSEIEFIKKGSFEQKELEAIVAALRLSISHENQKKQSENKSWGNSSRRNGRNDLPASAEKTVATLEAMGVRVYGSDMSHGVAVDGTISWDNIAGYEHQKREIEDTLLLALQNPELYDEIAHATRQKFESNRPRAVLFEGPPGTGKTSCARVIANQAGVPLLYVPLEVVMSKYYGESERLLGSVFSLANELPNGAIIFLDEIDSFAAARDNEMHEATRRLLSVILRQIDGFDQEKRVIVVAATNRKEDLDPALISRFDSMIFFGLPDQKNREEIAAQYAKHLNKPELVKLAAATEEMSGRDIRDVCQQAERSWASKIIRGEAPNDDMSRPPPLEEYIRCAEIRRKSLVAAAAEKGSARTGLNRMPPLGLL